MKMIGYGNTYYEVLGEFEYPFNFPYKEYVIKHNNNILYFRPDNITSQYMTLKEISDLILETEIKKFRNPIFREMKLNYLKNVKQLMRDNTIDEVLRKETIWQFG